MATSAELPRLSFGNRDTLDLSLSLPIVLLPPSDGTVPEEEDDDHHHDDDRLDDIDDNYDDNYEHRLDEEEAERTPTELVQPQIPDRDMRRVNHAKPATPPSPNVPVHPIPSMQAAFAESLLEVTDGVPVDKPKLRTGDAKARRDDLVAQEREEEPAGVRWRYRPGQEQHELWKLMAQISFGVYLLMNGMANSNALVVNILQGHIDEVDEFLEVAMEDFQQASKDLTERIDYLRLPMENLEVFEKLLEDRNFRLEIVEGNEKIEHIIARTNVQLKQYDVDVQCGLASAKEFAIYLALQKDGPWRRPDRPEVGDIYDAMKGNTEGWLNAFVELQSHGKEINSLVVKLGQMVAEMSKKAGEVSRRTWATIPPFTLPLQGTRSDENSLSSPPSSPPSSRSGSQSTPRANSVTGSVSTGRSNPNPAYFEVPARKPVPARSPDSQPAGSLSPPKLTLATGDSPSSDSRQTPVVAEPEDTEGMDAGPLYILQPRTYTPQPPEPLPSPMVRDAPPLINEPEQPTPKTQRQSLRQRISLKTTPPESIQIPPPNTSELHRPPYTSPRAYQAPDSAYSSDVDRPRFSSIGELSPPARPPIMPSPRSDQQFYRPVQASPHSPLMQRPHTAGNSASPRASYHTNTAYSPGHQRNVPSRMGGASMLSNVTTVTQESDATATVKGLKKKRSAFGWLKKAFSLDDEERMAFEARKQLEAQNLYYDGRSPKFLDGKRIR